MKVVVALSIGSVDFDPKISYSQKLIKSFPNVDFTIVRDIRNVVGDLSEAEILFAPLITKEMLAAAPKLKWFHSSSIQFGDFVEPEVFYTPIHITNSRGAFSVIVAENVIGAALFLAHRMDTTRNLCMLERKALSMAMLKSKRLKGAHMGIIGMGKNGTLVAKYAKALGMTVSGIKRNKVENYEYIDEVLPPAQINSVLERSNFLVITAPATSETKNMIGRDEINSLPKGAIVINAGKPEVDNDDAIVEALKSGQLYGYGCDDAIPDTSPIRMSMLPTTIIFPHAGPGAEAFWSGIFGTFSLNLAKYINGENLMNIFNRELKY